MTWQGKRMPDAKHDSAHLTETALTAGQREMLADAIDGLSRTDKSLPSKYFYDEEGSRLFDEITRLEEYYLTRTEESIMRRCGREIANALGPEVLLIEYGSGSSAKTRILLDRMQKMAGYVPVDISGEYLIKAAEQLRREFPHIPVLPVIADFTKPFNVPEPPGARRRHVIYFPGSTIGNFTPDDACGVLRQMAELCGPQGGILVGVDLLKPGSTLHDAYNDSKGVTARFNLNLLARLNRELGCDFDLGSFRHRAFFNGEESRVEMELVSQREQQVRLNGCQVSFRAGEPLLTEYSHKYTDESFSKLAAGAGFVSRCVWTDPDSLFSVRYLEPAGQPGRIG